MKRNERLHQKLDRYNKMATENGFEPIKRFWSHTAAQIAFNKLEAAIAEKRV